MDPQNKRDPRIATAEPGIDTSLLDSSDDPWMGGNDDMTAAQDDAARVTSEGQLATSNGSKLGASQLGHAEKQIFSGSSLVGDPEALRRQWESVQVGFVDDPRRTVQDAERLVSMVVEELVDNFRLQRQALEASWSEGSDRSINDLRQAFQRYRDFFERLLQI
jgi:hypothetical protein